MKIRSIAMITAAFVITGSIFAGGVPVAADDDGQTYEMTLIHSYSDQNIIGRNAKEFAAQVEEKTARRVKVNVFGNAQIVSTDKELSMLKEGTVQACLTAASIAETVNPLHQVYMIPFLMTTEELGDTSLFRAAREDELIEGTIAEYTEKAGYKMLAANIPPMQANYIFANNKKPLEAIGDGKGLKIRTPSGEMMTMIIESLGATPISISAAEVPIALSQGVVDGTWGSIICNYDSQWITKYMTLPFCTTNPNCLYLNLDWWNNLPAELQEDLEEAAQATFENACGFVETEIVDDLQKLQDEYGTEVTWLDMSLPENQEWAADLQQRGIDLFIEKNGDLGRDMVNEVLSLREELGLRSYAEKQ